jgi:hypothetical protein
MGTTEIERVRRKLRGEGWVEAAQVAALIFLTLLALGAALLVAGKLQFASLGSGSGPLEVLRAIGLVGLACLGVGIDIGGLTLSVIPLGGLSVVALSGTRLIRDVARRRERRTLGDVFKLGVALGVICGLAALVFRFGGDVPVKAGPFESAALGFVWGCALAALGAALASDRNGPASLVGKLDRPPLGDGARLSLGLGSWAAFGALGALLLLIAGRLAADPLPRWFGVGEAAAALIYLVAFLPNALVAIFSLAIGATLRLGAQVDVGGEIVGPLRELSLFSWGGKGPPAALFLLLVLPAAVSIGGGVRAARRLRTSASVARVGSIAAVLFALVVGVLASFADARLGAGLVRSQGVALVTVGPTQVALLTLLWTLVGGAVGVVLQRGIEARARRTSQ